MVHGSLVIEAFDEKPNFKNLQVYQSAKKLANQIPDIVLKKAFNEQ